MARKSRTPRRHTRPLGSLVQLEDRSVPAVAFALSGSSLLRFDTDNPAAALPPLAITGIGAGETLAGIDFRPQNGQLYGVSSNAAGGARVYAIGTKTGVATPLTAAPVTFDDGVNPVPIPGGNWGVDFNPTVDRIRVVTDGGFNFRIDPNTGKLVDGDKVAPGVNPDGVLNTDAAKADGTAYTNNSPGATATTQYTIDAASDKLFIQNPSNGGKLNAVAVVTLGGTPLDFAAANGFDLPAGVTTAVSGDPATGAAFAALTVGGSTGLYSIDLATAKATLVGTLGGGTAAVQGLAVQSDQTGTGGQPLVGLTADGLSLVRFSAATPGTVTTIPIASGIAVGETLVGIDYRPATGQLLALGVDAVTDTATLYVLDPQGAAGVTSATAIGTAGSVKFVADDGTTKVDLPAAAAGYGFDVNPAADRVRVVTASGLNFRANPNDGAPEDGNAGATGTQTDKGLNDGATKGDATAYTNSFAQVGGSGVTTQYTLDAATDKLFLQNPPNDGKLTAVAGVTLGGAPLDFTAVNGFDIPGGVAVAKSGEAATGLALAALTVGASTGLYTIDLATGKAALLGAIGTGLIPLAGLSGGDAPAGSVEFTAAAVTVAEDKGTATVTLTRTGGTSGPLTVNVAVSGGTATAGEDFTAPPTTVTFAAGATTATLDIPITDDKLFEAGETIELTLSAPSAGGLGDQTKATVTITDNDTAPTVSINDVSALEGGSGTTAFTFTVVLSAAAGTPVTVTADTANGTAVGGEDFTALSKQLVTFAPGVTSQTVTVQVTGDNKFEPDEAFAVLLSAPTGGVTVADAVGFGTILNDDKAGPNTGPTITDIANQTVAVNATAGPVAFTVNDAETPAEQLAVSFTTSNAKLVPAANVGIGGAGKDRSIIVVPAAGQTGTATITVTVTDASGATASDSFTVTVGAAPGTPPTIGDIPNVVTTVGTPIASPVVVVGDAETPPANLTVTATSSNQALLPDANVTFTGSGANRTINLTPVAGQTGVSTVTVTVTDADGRTATDTFTVVVNPAATGTAPTITAIDDKTTTTGTAVSAAFTVADAETPAGSLTVTSSSSNTTLVPAGNVVVTGTGGARTVTVTPAANQTGTATITLVVTDAAGLQAAEAFTLTVSAPGANTAPTISNIPNRTTAAGTSTGAIGFTVGDAETPNNLTVAATSSNQALIPLGNINLGGSGANRTINLTPVAGQTGVSTITVTVTDPSGLTATDTFTVQVGTNAAPTISNIVDLTIPTGQTSAAVTFTVGDAETAAATLQVSAASSNAALFPAGSLAFTGTGANRTLTLTPSAGQTGSATITVTVTDEGGQTASDTFVVTVPTAAGNRGLVGYREFGVGSDRGSGVAQLYNPDKSLRFSLEPFAGFTGGVRTAAGDFNNDGVADLVVGTGPGRSTLVRVLDGKTQTELFSVAPFESTFTGGVYVAAGDVTGDGVADLVITPDEGGGPRVRVFNGGGGFTVLADFFGIDDVNFRGGARAAVGDVNGDGVGDLVVAAGFQGGPRVAAFNGKTLPGNQPARLFNDFFAFEQTLRNGVFITAGDIDGDGKAEVIAGGGPGGGPRVTAFSAKDLISSGGGTLTQVANFFGGDPNNRGGIRVAVKDLDGDNRADLVVGSGSKAGSRVTSYLGANIQPAGTPAAQFDFDAFPGFTGGVFVG